MREPGIYPQLDQNQCFTNFLCRLFNCLAQFFVQSWLGYTTAKMAKNHIFWKFLAKKHYFENKWQSTTFSRTRVLETRVPHQFYHRGTAKLEFVRLKKIMWYSSLVNSSTMQHNTRVYQARVPFIKKKKFTKYSSLVNSSIV